MPSEIARTLSTYHPLSTHHDISKQMVKVVILTVVSVLIIDSEVVINRFKHLIKYCILYFSKTVVIIEETNH